MKDYCPECNGDMDEVDLEYKMCDKCYSKSIPRLKDDAMIKIKIPKLIIINKKKLEELYYVCNTVKWNYFLNRYYPNAELVLKRCQLDNHLTLMVD